MVKKTFVMVLLVLCCTEFSYANILLSDTIVVFEPNSRSKRLEITNISDTAKRYRIEFVNYRQLPDGRYEQLEGDDSGIRVAGPYLHLSPRSFSLKPRETQTIRLFKKNAKFKTAEAGEYRSHLLVREVEKLDQKQDYNETAADGLSINISALMGMSLPVIVQQGALSHQTKIASAKLVFEDNMPFLEITLTRSGTKSSRGNVTVYLGKQKIGIAKHVNVLYPLESRTIRVPLDQDKAGSAPLSASQLRNKVLDLEYSESVNGKERIVSKLNYTTRF